MSDKHIWGALVLDDTNVVKGGASYQMVNDACVIVNKTVGSATAISLPKGKAHGQCVIVKDGKGDARTNPITISDPGGATIDGQAQMVLGINFQAVELEWDAVSSPALWRVMETENFVPNGGGFQLNTVQDGLTAHSGGGQANGTPITAMVARFSTVAVAADSGTLPPSVPGMQIAVVNATANSMNVFPATGETINTGAANAAIAVAGNTVTIFFCLTAGAWWTK